MRGAVSDDTVDVGLDDAPVAEGQARRDLPHFPKVLPGCGLFRLHDQVAHSELLDEGHHLLLGPGSDRQHGDHRRHAEDHTQHGQQGAQLVNAEVFDALQKVWQYLRYGVRAHEGRQGMGRGHRPPPPTRDDWFVAPLEPGLPGSCSGLTRATTVPSRTPSIATWLSVRRIDFHLARHEVASLFQRKRTVSHLYRRALEAAPATNPSSALPRRSPAR